MSLMVLTSIQVQLCVVCACEQRTIVAPHSSVCRLPSLCVLTVGYRRSTPRSRSPRSPPSHGVIVTIKSFYSYIFFPLCFFCSLHIFFRSEHTYSGAPTATAECVFYEPWTKKKKKKACGGGSGALNLH